MTPTPAEQISAELQASLRPGEKLRKGPGGALYLGDGRFFVAKFNPMEQRASVHAFPLEELGEVRVESGSEERSFVELEVPGYALTGITGDETAYSLQPNVIYCGRGAEAEQLAQQIVRALRSAAAPPPPPPPPPEPEPAPAVPADWYPDPHGVARLRYWDGSAWTDHVAD